jgi:DNA-binding PadR family transcriptional regulator
MHSHSHAFDPRLAGWFAMSRGGPRRRRGGPGPRGFGGFGGPRGPRARRGDVRAALLALLAEEPRNGYQLMQEIEQRSDGIWRPSPGSVYPALQQLEDEGLVRTTESGGGRAYELTDEGRADVEARDNELAAPWDAVKGDAREGHFELMQLARQAAMAAGQILHAGSDAQVAEAKEVLNETRKSLYRILAEDPSEEAEPPQEV